MKKIKKVYDVVYNMFADMPNFNELPEHMKKWKVTCTCRDERTARNMLAMQNKLCGVYKIVEREVKI